MSLLPGFPQPIPPYRHPVPPVGIDPDAPPSVQICINVDWLAYVVGALKSLQLVATWDTNDPDEMQLQIQRSNLLLAMFSEATEGCGLLPPGILCISGSFHDVDYGFATAAGAVCDSLWIAGTGWTGCYDTTNSQDVVLISRAFDNATFIRTYTVHGHIETLFSETLTVTFFYLGVQVFQDTITETGGGPISLGGDVNLQADFELIELNHAAIVHDANPVIDDWALCYTGDFPLAGQSTWEFTIDFTVTDGGALIGTVFYGSWTSGLGWVGGTGDGPSFYSIRVWIDPSPFHCLSLSLTWSFANLAGDDAGVVRGFSGVETGTALMSNDAEHVDGSSGTDVVSVAHPPADVQSILIGTDSYRTGGGFITLSKLTIRGSGFNPFV